MDFKVKSVFLHKSLTAPGMSVNAADSLVPQKYPRAKYTLIPEGIIIEDNGHTGLIPIANVAFLMLEKEEKNGLGSK